MKHSIARSKALSIPAALACLLSASLPAAAADIVTLAYPQAIGVNNADIGYGIKLGIFAEENIEVKMVALEGSARMVPQIANGSITAGFAHPDYMLAALDKGDPPPVKYVYNWRRRSPYEITVQADSPYKSVADLKSGKKIGIGALTWANAPMIRAVSKDNGLRWGEDVQLVPIGTGPAAWKQLQTGAVQALAYYAAENEKIIASGIPLRKLDIGKYSAMFTSGILISNATLSKNPDLVRRLGRAIAKTTVACSANLEACVKGAWVLDPTLKPAPDKEADWVKQYLPLQKANYADMMKFEQGEPQQLGRYPDSGWETHVAVMNQAGVLKKKDLPVKTIYTNEFVADFNKFDRQALEARARADK